MIEHDGNDLHLSCTILEGHRFAIEPAAAGSRLLSWGLPFGTATRDLRPGDPLCNQQILDALAERNVNFELPTSANFSDYLQPYRLDASSFRAGRQVALVERPTTFEGYLRDGGRGTGTRNFVVVLGTTSRTAAFAEALAARFGDSAKRYRGIDGVVPVIHTEGGGDPGGPRPNNLAHVLRTLAGMLVHPNVGAVLAVDNGDEVFTNDTLRTFMREHDYPLDAVLHRFARLDGPFDETLEREAAVIESWLPGVSAQPRERCPLSALKVALQCGGSDAFSGVSGNALAGFVAKQIVRNGGSANLAETDELIGAEPYVLSNVRDLDTAQRFLRKIEAFKIYASHHGASAEGNPSGGNHYRGLYNIALKSIGAARKKDPEVRLDHVIDYAQPMTGGGYYFMDSPGNDLESIAGQVAAGANLIFFITGNGSITNFPFVPTLKFVTTTGRFSMLASEMDINAGRYNDGESMESLGAETFQLARRVASGEKSKGERAGHAQVQIWRDWPQHDASQLAAIRSTPRPQGRPLRIAVDAHPASDLRFDALPATSGFSTDQIGLVMPTSLCSGQVARLIADRLNAGNSGRAVTRYLALAHTEGCGSVNAEGLYLQTLVGHLQHPFTRAAVLLEHGCEKTHNDAVRHYLDLGAPGRGVRVDPARFGWASIQLDGGLEAVSAKVIEWFDATLASRPLQAPTERGAADLRIAIAAAGRLADIDVEVLAVLIGRLVSAGATVVVPANARFLTDEGFRARLSPSNGESLAGESRADWRPTLAYGEPARVPGLHLMQMPTDNPSEVLTGLGGSGVEVMVAMVAESPLQAHPMIPLLQIASAAAVSSRFARDLDAGFAAGDSPEVRIRLIESLIADTASRRYRPSSTGVAQVYFSSPAARSVFRCEVRLQIPGIPRIPEVPLETLAHCAVGIHSSRGDPDRYRCQLRP